MKKKVITVVLVLLFCVISYAIFIYIKNEVVTNEDVVAKTSSSVTEPNVNNSPGISNQYFIEENGQVYFLGKKIEFVYTKYKGGLPGPGNSKPAIVADRKVFDVYQGPTILETDDSSERYYFSTQLSPVKTPVQGIDRVSFEMLVATSSDDIELENLADYNIADYIYQDLGTERKDGKTAVLSKTIAEDKNYQYTQKIYRYSCFGDTVGCPGEEELVFERK